MCQHMMSKETLQKFIPKSSLTWQLLRKIYNAPRKSKKAIWRFGRKATQSSIFIRKSEMYMCSLFPVKILDKTKELFHPTTVLDLGAGVGKAIDYFLLHHIDAVGVEGSGLAIKQALHPELITKYNLNKEFNLHKKFDMVWSFEFVEHIHPNYIKELMNTISNHSDLVVMSAARPNQGGEGHFNEQDDAYWIEQFSQYGYTLDKAATSALREIDEMFSKNMYVFKR